jgi:hypothetical protein
MIAENHEVAWLKRAIHSTSRVGQQNVSNAVCGQHPHGESHQLHRVPFVIVGPSVQHNNRGASQATYVQLACVPADAHRWKAWKAVKINARVDLQSTGHMMKTGAEHQRQSRPQRRQVFQLGYALPLPQRGS